MPKYGHNREACGRRQTCAKCAEKNRDHMEEDCSRQIRCANCRQIHPAYARSCNVDKKEKEILALKHKRNVSFLEERKIVGTYVGENSYASFARRVDTINRYKYRALVKKFIQLESNDWPKLQEHLRKLHSAEFYQAQTQKQVKNKEKINEVV